MSDLEQRVAALEGQNREAVSWIRSLKDAMEDRSKRLRALEGHDERRRGICSRCREPAVVATMIDDRWVCRECLDTDPAPPPPRKGSPEYERDRGMLDVNATPPAAPPSEGSLERARRLEDGWKVDRDDPAHWPGRKHREADIPRLIGELDRLWAFIDSEVCICDQDTIDEHGHHESCRVAALGAGGGEA